MTQGDTIPKCPNCGNDTLDTRYHGRGKQVEQEKVQHASTGQIVRNPISAERIADGRGFRFTAEAACLLFRSYATAPERGALPVTSNRPVVATAILDRSLCHSHIVTIRGKYAAEPDRRWHRDGDRPIPP